MPTIPAPGTARNAGGVSLDPIWGMGMNTFVTNSAGVPIPGGGGGGGGVGTPSAGVPSNISSVMNLINSLNRTAQQQSNAARIPNAQDLEAQSSLNIGHELRGELSPDVIRLLQQQGAERGVGRGIGGSPNEIAAYLRALGLTSLDQQKTGQANLSAALGRNPGAPLFDPTGLIMTPYQSAQLAAEQQRIKLAQDQLALEAWKAQQANQYAYDENKSKYGPKEYSYSYTQGPGAGSTASPTYAYRYYA